MEKSFEYEGKKIPYDLIYKKRNKTIQIEVKRGGRIKITAPAGLPENEIISRVMTRSKWILEKMDHMDNEPALKPKTYENGETFPLLGKEYPIQIVMDPSLKGIYVQFIEEGIIVIETPTRDETWLARGVESWYRSQTRGILQERIAYYQPIVRVRPAKIRIKAQKKSWGSCSSLRNLNFNWRLAMLPPPVIDYIVVHELCHLVHLNHSKEFWALVESILPEQNQLRNWLNVEGGKYLMLTLIEVM